MNKYVSLLAFGACMTLSAAATSDKAAQEQFQRASDEYFDQVYFPHQPIAGTVWGYHQYDAKLDDLASGSIDAEVAALDSFEKRISAIPAASLDQTTRADRELVLNQIRSRRLTLQTIRPWAKNADYYSSLCASGVFTLMERKFAPSDDRLRSLIAREKKMPVLLVQARANLQNPPRIFTEIAIEQLPGIIAFFQHDVPLAFADAQDEALKAEFAKSNAAVIGELTSYMTWLRSDLLPRSNGDFRIGADTFSKKLQYDEMVDIPLPRLLEVGYADLHRNQQHFAEVAKELEPDKTPREVLEELGHQHPSPDQLLNSFRATFSSLLDFIRSHHIVTIPSDVRPVLEETPPFMRATTQASMDSPGPFETKATTSYFNVTLPDPSMTPAEVEGYMHSYNIGTVISTSVHEAYPGHYVQYLYSLKAPTRVRKILQANTNIEGWAHYTEQMMLDNGYGQPGIGARDAREAKFLRLGQLQDALLRNARFIVGIQMHTGNMTYDQAVEFFQKEGYQPRETSIVEAKRGAGDPTYLYYTLGKLEILKLREDLMKKQGSAFSLQKFHDDFLSQGFPPIKVIREAMLGDGSPTL
ncbi:DUF885 domain-containing protein [Occallatibacter savannae]|uniref:DUF885 domain-containing protein n=1 Tax=Occallatibacter savannae TaxID=1002691 RepID=UPI001EF4539D|nr:DUF885 domain-containing protein [Occallatibacter savannae]